MDLRKLRNNILKYPTEAIELPQADDSLAQPGAPEGSSSESPVILVHSQALQRECLAHGLVEHNPALKLATTESLDGLRSVRSQVDVAAVVVVLSGKISDQDIRTQLSHFVSEAGDAPVVVVADSDTPVDILAALDCGARGYISTSVGVRVVAEAIGLARAGGIFVPASAVLAMRNVILGTANDSRPYGGTFTLREMSVVEALKKGKPNKIIAYDLNLCESTVKVHIRNIMKKLKATNRTEVAYKLREMDPQER